mmetsp:Transcript_20510/g.59474  ORF Transcript_20510/g.59474 Transcript_20510/m.59474 type:complete len:225 (-) Transcript_20510:1308-1982(-)
MRGRERRTRLGRPVASTRRTTLRMMTRETPPTDGRGTALRGPGRSRREGCFCHRFRPCPSPRRACGARPRRPPWGGGGTSTARRRPQRPRRRRRMRSTGPSSTLPPRPPPGIGTPPPSYPPGACSLPGPPRELRLHLRGDDWHRGRGGGLGGTPRNGARSTLSSPRSRLLPAGPAPPSRSWRRRRASPRRRSDDGQRTRTTASDGSLLPPPRCCARWDRPSICC